MRAILFQNGQWIVDEDGVTTAEDAESEYWFEADRLLETTTRGGTTYYDWPVHMAEKTWVDIEAFIEAFEKALELLEGKYKWPVDTAMLTASLGVARRIADQTRRESRS